MRAEIVIVISLLTITFCSTALGSEPTALTVGGTGSGVGFMRLLGKSYTARHPEVTVEVLPSIGSGGGIRALKMGALDLAIVSRQLQENEKVGMKGYFLGESPFVFAVHPETKIDDVTLSQVANIYNGTISTWPDGKRVRRILRPPNDSDWQLMRRLSPELEKALEIAQQSKGLHLAVTDTDAISYLERVLGSFGPSTLTMALTENRNVKILSLNGIQPSTIGHDQESYPLKKPYYLVIRTDASIAVKNFTDFICSAQGQGILARVGIITEITTR